MTGPQWGRGMGLWRKRIPAGVLGIVLTLAALFLLADPINVVAYYLGYGDEMQVRVVVGTGFDAPSDDAEPGWGRVIGEDRIVELYGVSAGEVVTARPRLIELGARRYVYTGHASVLWGLTSIFGVAVLGVLGVLLCLFGLAPPSLLARLAPMSARLAGRLSKHSKRGETKRGEAKRGGTEDPGRFPSAS